MSNVIKFAVPVPVEVDLDVWSDTYGLALDEAEADMRVHVPATIAGAVHQAFRAQANGAELVGDLFELVED